MNASEILTSLIRKELFMIQRIYCFMAPLRKNLCYFPWFEQQWIWDVCIFRHSIMCDRKDKGDYIHYLIGTHFISKHQMTSQPASLLLEELTTLTYSANILLSK
ncbi:CLUMA_CG021073, isoform A [Clunio marinus]|uniref:CLUMA_CG021073, isoform A n=1 Tax=Clunio marinus TaxID=568069 RepID=A0A1J1J8V3_9DIPT|nr:CLUMA_CG021073, isoform A [Clunio marinus]